jgi:ABC-type metal ion transport system substrate-binding protein
MFLNKIKTLAVAAALFAVLPAHAADKLKPDVGFLGSINDMVENPKHLTFVEVEGPQLARVTGDVDIVEGYPHFIVAAKAFNNDKRLYTLTWV